MTNRLSQTRRDAQGQRLKAARELAEYSITEVAEKTGNKPAAVRGWESGTVPHPSTRELLAELYGYDESFLFLELFQERAQIKGELADYAFDPELTRQRVKIYGPPWIYVPHSVTGIVHLSTDHLLQLRKCICEADFGKDDQPARATGIGNLATCVRCLGRTSVVTELILATFGGTDPRVESESL